MKLDLNTLILDAEDKAIEEEGKVVNVGIAFKRALLTDTDKVEDKLKRFELWLKLKTATLETEFSVAEVALLDNVIAFFPTLIHGRLSHFLSQTKQG